MLKRFRDKKHGQLQQILCHGNPDNVLRRTKRLIREGQSMSLDSVLQMSAGLRVIAHKSPQHLQTLDVFIEKRPPVFSDQ